MPSLGPLADSCQGRRQSPCPAIQSGVWAKSQAVLVGLGPGVFSSSQTHSNTPPSTSLCKLTWDNHDTCSLESTCVSAASPLLKPQKVSICDADPVSCYGSWRDFCRIHCAGTAVMSPSWTLNLLQCLKLVSSDRWRMEKSIWIFQMPLGDFLLLFCTWC